MRHTTRLRGLLALLTVLAAAIAIAACGGDDGTSTEADSTGSDSGNLIADYPATVGSSDTPSPHGTHVVNAVALNPTYTYNPQRNFKQGDNDRVLIVPPGPNAPVGNVWIDLSEPTYGIHGTPTPSQLFVNQSHGCVRLTNWDAVWFSAVARPGLPVQFR